MSTFNIWKPDSPPLFRWLAVGLVTSAEEICEMILSSGSDQLFEARKPIRKDSKWLQLYSRRRKVFAYFTSYFFKTDDSKHLVRAMLYPIPRNDLGDWVKDSIKAYQDSSERRKKSCMRLAARWVRQMNEMHQEVTSMKITDDELESVAEIYAESQEAWFLISVAAPCLIVYGQFPSQLLESATNRNSPCFESLGRLVALDKNVLKHRRVNWLVNDAKPTWRKCADEVIQKCYGRSVSKGLDRTSIKCSIAAWISRFADVLAVRLTKTELRELFDLNARIIAGKQSLPVHDFDLPDGDEAFYKAYSRKKKEFKVFKSDKKFAELVRSFRKAA